MKFWHEHMLEMYTHDALPEIGSNFKVQWHLTVHVNSMCSMSSIFTYDKDMKEFSMVWNKACQIWNVRKKCKYQYYPKIEKYKVKTGLNAYAIIDIYMRNVLILNNSLTRIHYIDSVFVYDIR